MSGGLPVARYISTTVNLAPSAAQANNVNTAMVIGDSNVIDVGQRYRIYNTLNQVAADFGTTAPEYLAAALFFRRRPCRTNRIECLLPELRVVAYVGIQAAQAIQVNEPAPFVSQRQGKLLARRRVLNRLVFDLEDPLILLKVRKRSPRVPDHGILFAGPQMERIAQEDIDQTPPFETRPALDYPFHPCPRVRAHPLKLFYP